MTQNIMFIVTINHGMRVEVVLPLSCSKERPLMEFSDACIAVHVLGLKMSMVRMPECSQNRDF